MRKKDRAAEKVQQAAVKNYFDRIAPGVIRFYTDHYLCGNFYRSVWAVTEYPPTTEESPC